jgi:uncharacterized cofD-like protein
MTRVVALGGGHGTAVTLRAARRYADEVTAIVSVADDGGSTGRLRKQLDVVALGDLRKCLVALAADGSVLARAFEHRFSEGDLAGHPLGNVLLAGMVEAAGGLVAGVDESARLLQAVGRVLPATVERVVLKAVGDLGEVNGQVAVSAAGRIDRVSLVPEGCEPPDEALAAIAAADQIVIGPGSLFTSVLAAAAVAGIAKAIEAASAQRVYVCNLRPQLPETEGYGVVEHLLALERHGVTVDAVLWDPSAGMRRSGADPGAAPRAAGASSPRAPGVPRVAMVERELAGRNGLVHNPEKLAVALADLLASGREHGGQSHDDLGRQRGAGRPTSSEERGV